MSKVIVFDLDETLRSLETSIKDNEVKVVLRPKITELLKKLVEVKEVGVDSVIFTSASMSSAKKYFLEKLPAEYRDVFAKVITRENFLEAKPGTRENYLYRRGTNKIVTALDYDEILFFDDNRTEYQFLQELFDENLNTKYPVPEKNVTFVSLPFYPRREIEMYSLKEMAKECEKTKYGELSEKIRGYFNLMINEPGCKIMTEIIDDFVSKDQTKGLVDINGTEVFDRFEDELRKAYHDIDDTIDNDPWLGDKYRDYEEEYYSKIEEPDIQELF